MAPPDDLADNHRAAWQTLADGGSYKDAAKAAGVSAGTISKLVARWRKQHGAHLFRSERQQAAAAQTSLAREAAEQFWSELRRDEARRLGITASQIRSRVLLLLDQVGTARVDRGPDGTSAPVVVRGVDAREVKALTDALTKMIEAAELLEDRPTRHHRRSVPSDQWVNPATTADTASNPDDDLQRAVMSDPELAEQYAAFAEAVWARTHPNDT